jgi:hypothetical protein
VPSQKWQKNSEGELLQTFYARRFWAITKMIDKEAIKESIRANNPKRTEEFNLAFEKATNTAKRYA